MLRFLARCGIGAPLWRETLRLRQQPESWGAVSGELLDACKEWMRFRPALCIVDLSSNDLDKERFARNLTGIAELNREHGIPALFVLEPNAIECDGDFVSSGRHGIMREIAGRFGIPVVDAQNYLAQKRRYRVSMGGLCASDVIRAPSYCRGRD